MAYFQSNQELPTFYNLSDTEITGKIISLVQTEEKLSLIIKGKEKIQANYYNDLPTSLELGDLVKLKGNLKLPTNNTVPNNFNYKHYLKHKGINYTMTVDKVTLLKENTNIFYKIKNSLKKRLNQFTYSDYLYTFILGDKNYLDDNIYESYRNNGVVHLFCISGTHITLLTGMLLYLLRKLKLSYVKSYIIVFIFLLFSLIFSLFYFFVFL